MPDENVSQENTDAAWAEFNTPLDQNSLLEFCQDIERLFRINPYLVFASWESISNHQHRIHVTNYSQTPAFNVETHLNVQNIANGLLVQYDQGLKSSTTFTVEATPAGSKLIISENYEAATKDERLRRLHEVDKSLTKWAEEIQAYLIRWQRWSWFKPWCYYMRHIWQPMKPAARRITYMLIWISIIEIALIGLGAMVYLIEYR